MDTLSNQIFQAFHLSGLTVPFLLHPTHIMFLFQFHVMKCNRGASIGHRPTLLSPPSNTKYSADIIPCTHTHVMRCSAHQCNAIVPLHFMSCPMYNDYYKDIIYRHYTVCHGQFMSNAHNCHKSYKHVNISNLAYINKNHPCNHHASCIIITQGYDFHISINHGQLSYLA